MQDGRGPTRHGEESNSRRSGNVRGDDKVRGRVRVRSEGYARWMGWKSMAQPASTLNSLRPKSVSGTEGGMERQRTKHTEFYFLSVVCVKLGQQNESKICLCDTHITFPCTCICTCTCTCTRTHAHEHVHVHVHFTLAFTYSFSFT